MTSSLTLSQLSIRDDFRLISDRLEPDIRYLSDLPLLPYVRLVILANTLNIDIRRPGGRGRPSRNFIIHRFHDHFRQAIHDAATARGVCLSSNILDVESRLRIHESECIWNRRSVIEAYLVKYRLGTHGSDCDKLKRFLVHAFSAHNEKCGWGLTIVDKELVSSQAPGHSHKPEGCLRCPLHCVPASNPTLPEADQQAEDPNAEPSEGRNLEDQHLQPSDNDWSLAGSYSFTPQITPSPDHHPPPSPEHFQPIDEHGEHDSRDQHPPADYDAYEDFPPDYIEAVSETGFSDEDSDDIPGSPCPRRISTPGRRDSAAPSTRSSSPASSKRRRSSSDRSGDEDGSNASGRRVRARFDETALEAQMLPYDGEDSFYDGSEPEDEMAAWLAGDGVSAEEVRAALEAAERVRVEREGGEDDF